MKKTNKKGFTLVELVIVIAVIAILAGVLIGTFASVISRANQSKAVQEWKARVDEAYVEYVAENHKAPTHVIINKTAKTIVFTDSKNTTAADKIELTITLYTSNTGDGASKNSQYFVLDETNKVYFLWTVDNQETTYLVAAVNTTPTDDAAFTTGKYVKTGETTYDAAETYKVLTNNNLTYHGK